MAVTENIEKPTLYSLYGKQYDYNDLQRAYDQGFSNYIGGLRKGNKREQEYRDAGLNIMSGIKDGSITFQDGRFVDSRARYKNIETKNRNEDYYGIMANYIYGLMGKSKEYVEPKPVEEKPETQTLTTTETSKVETPKEETPKEVAQENPKPVKQEAPLEYSQQGLYDYANQNYGRLPNDSLDFDTNYKDVFGTWTATQYLTLIDKMSDQELAANFLAAVNNPDLDFSTTSTFQKAVGNKAIPVSSQWVASMILKTLSLRNKLIRDPNQPNILYIPDIRDKYTNSGFYYDTTTKKIHKRSMQDIPYWQQQIYKEFKGKTTNNWTSQFFTPYFKEGGIVKAKDGTSLWYSDLMDVTEDSFIPTYDTSKLYSGTFTDPYISNIVGKGIGRYAPSEGNNRETVTALEKSDYYKQFGNDIFNEDGTFNDLGLKWAQEVDKLLPKGSKASFFDENGKLRTSWQTTNNDVYGRPGQTFNNLKDYVNYVRNDGILGARHNIFGKTGNRYFYTDNEGNQIWVNPEDLSKYNISSAIQTFKDGVLWNDFELTGLKDSKDKSSLQTEIDPVTGKSKIDITGTIKGIGDNLLDVVPEILEAKKLYNSIVGGNKSAEILKKSTIPKLHDPLNLYSPVTGDLSAQNYFENQGAEVLSKANNWMTSDASLQLANEHNAMNSARELSNKGRLADAQRQKETSARNQTLNEKSAISKVETGNYDKDSMVDTIRRKGEIDAYNNNNRVQSKNNYLTGLIQRLTAQRLKNQTNKQQLALLDLDQQYKDAVAQIDKTYKLANPNATAADMARDFEYIDAIKQLQNWRQYQLGQAQAGTYNIVNIDPGQLSDIIRGIRFSRNGSKLTFKKQYKL